MTPLEFYGAVWSDEPLAGSLVTCHFPEAGGCNSQWHDSIESAARATEGMSQATDVYAGVTLQRGEKSPFSRGSAATAAAIPGFAGDVDHGDKGNGKPYPPDEAAAVKLIYEMPREPTLIIRSSVNGLQPYWLLKEPLVFENQKQHDDVERQSEAWWRLLQQKAKRHKTDGKPWALDSTFDLARVLRPAGTFNYRHGRRQSVDVLEYHPARRYQKEDFEFDGWESLADELNVPQNGFTVGPFVIPTAPLPREQIGEHFTALWDNVDSKLKYTWARNRPDFADQSMSSFQFSIALELFRLGAGAQEIVNAIVTFRLLGGGYIKNARWFEQELRRIAKRAGELDSESELSKQIIDRLKIIDVHNEAAAAVIKSDVKRLASQAKHPVPKERVEKLFSERLNHFRETDYRQAATAIAVAAMPVKPDDGWRAIRLNGDPTQWKLFSPFWDGYLLLTTKEIKNIDTVDTLAADKKKATLPPAINNRKFWRGSVDKPGRYDRLIAEATDEQALPEERRSAVVAELLLEAINRAAEKRDRPDEPDTRGQPVKLEDGTVAFKFRWMLEDMQRRNKTIEHGELVSLIKSVGLPEIQPRILGSRQRFKIVKPGDLEAIEKIAMGEDVTERVERTERLYI